MSQFLLPAKRFRTVTVAMAAALVLSVSAPAMAKSDSATQVGYSAATDQGSLYNVALRAGIDAGVAVTGRGIQIAMIDTGVVDVPGLRNSNISIGPDFSFEDADPEARARDTNGHGTHLAGIMVASDKAWVDGDHTRSPDRVLGIAPDADLLSIKVATADGGVDVTQVIAALDWVVANRTTGANNVRVLNLAFGTDSLQPYQIDPLSYAVERAWHAGIVVVVAAGNDGADAKLRNPAIDPFVIAVGSAEAANGKNSKKSNTSEYSSSGEARGVDLLAPGRSIVSLRVPGSFSDQFNGQGRIGSDLVRGSGTSQAAAVVSGLAALLLESDPSLTPDQVKNHLMTTGRKVAGSQTVSINFASALWDKVQDSVQQHEPAAGTGSIDASRGSIRVVVDGVVLAGESDIFGNSWSGNSWSGNSWSGNSWSGNSWSGNSWSGNSWSGNSWSGNSWSGNSWSGNSWSGNSWSGNSWSGNSWSGNSWSGNSWSGNSWSGNSWSGNSWSDHTWS